MPAIIMAAIAVGVVMMLALSLLTRSSAKKLYLNMSERNLVEARLRNQSLVRRFIVIQVLAAVFFGFVLIPANNHPNLDRNTVLAFFILFMFVCVGLRGMFRNMKIAAEAELEFRKLHPTFEKGGDQAKA